MAKKEEKHPGGEHHGVHHCCEAIKALADAFCHMHCECEHNEHSDECCFALMATLCIMEGHLEHLAECCPDFIERGKSVKKKRDTQDDE